MMDATDAWIRRLHAQGHGVRKSAKLLGMPYSVVWGRARGMRLPPLPQKGAPRGNRNAAGPHRVKLSDRE
jgi:hypothetical protein